MVSSKGFGSVVNHVCIFDPVPFLCDPIGIIRSFFDPDIKIDWIFSWGDGLCPHRFANSAYQEAIKAEGEIFVNKVISRR